MRLQQGRAGSRVAFRRQRAVLPSATFQFFEKTMSAVIQEEKPYERLLALPENLVGEIIDGELYTQPRPAGPHASASSVRGMDIGSAQARVAVIVVD